MLRERVSTNIHIFTSELYVQATASAIITPQGAIVIDTLPLPAESREMASFVSYHCPAGVKFVVLTHHHADHTYGAYLYPEAHVVAHTRCRELLSTEGQQSLEAAKEEAPELEEVVLRLPDLTLDSGELKLHVGDSTLRLLATPGHTEDTIAAFVEETRVLLASDTVMPVPVVIDGDLETLKSSLLKLLDLRPESIVQGHGEVILRGEVQAIIKRNISYLDAIWDLANKAASSGDRESLYKTNIEKFGLSRVALDGRAEELHTANLIALYDRLAG
jgi:glyoxylase-like metal-dependent hydrolase (beta-lactamase superfamily II)